jgi:hypothetical protein
MNHKPKIVISKPCLADWDKMTPCEQGRHCKSCDKTVVDFTKMTSVQIDAFILQNFDKKICGNFQINQIAIEKCNKFYFFVYRYHQFYRSLKIKGARVTVLLTLGVNLFLASCGYSDKPIENLNKVKKNRDLTVTKPTKNHPNKLTPTEDEPDDNIKGKIIEIIQLRGEVCAPEEPDTPPIKKK